MPRHRRSWALLSFVALLLATLAPLSTCCCQATAVAPVAVKHTASAGRGTTAMRGMIGSAPLCPCCLQAPTSPSQAAGPRRAEPSATRLQRQSLPALSGGTPALESLCRCAPADSSVVTPLSQRTQPWHLATPAFLPGSTATPVLSQRTGLLFIAPEPDPPPTAVASCLASRAPPAL